MVEAKRPETAVEEMTARLPSELASAANVFAPQFAAMAAASAVGVGLASQGFGLWLGTVSAFAEASQRMFSPVYGQLGSGAASFMAKRSPAVTAKSATTGLIEYAGSTAQVISLAGKREGGKRKL